MNNFQQINETGILIQIWDSGAVLFLFLVFRLRSEKINVKNLQSTENTTWIKLFKQILVRLKAMKGEIGFLYWLFCFPQQKLTVYTFDKVNIRNRF